MRNLPRLSAHASWHTARRGLGVLTLALAGLVAVASPVLAVSTHDLVELSRAGLSDDVLVALIEADHTVFNLDAPRILDLCAQGLSERVITAMLRSGRSQAAGGTDTAQAALSSDASGGSPPTLVIIGERSAPPPVPVQPQVLVVPWVIPVAAPSHGPAPVVPLAAVPAFRGFGRFINNGWVDRRRFTNTGWVDGRTPSGARR